MCEPENKENVQSECNENNINTGDSQVLDFQKHHQNVLLRHRGEIRQTRSQRRPYDQASLHQSSSNQVQTATKVLTPNNSNIIQQRLEQPQLAKQPQLVKQPQPSYQSQLYQQPQQLQGPQLPEEPRPGHQSQLYQQPQHSTLAHQTQYRQGPHLTQSTHQYQLYQQPQSSLHPQQPTLVHQSQPQGNQQPQLTQTPRPN